MRKIRTLLYHRVINLEMDTHLLAVSEENFYNQMRWLKARYPIIKFDADWDSVKEDAICITFDDGYKDNFERAIPILEELEIPATIFVSSGNLNTDYEMWWDELERNLLVPRNYLKEFKLLDEVYGCILDTDSVDRRRDLYYSLHRIMKDGIGSERRENWLEQLRKWNRLDRAGREDHRMTTIDELQNINNSLITIGAHTINHPTLARLNYDKQFEEISVSKRVLEKVLGYKVNTFSYPFGGREDYNEDTLRVCEELEFIRVAANYPGDWENGNKYEVPRRIVRNWSANRFEQEFRGMC